MDQPHSVEKAAPCPPPARIRIEETAPYPPPARAWYHVGALMVF